MKSFARTALLAGLFAVLLGLAACASPTPQPGGPRDLIYGRWIYKDPKAQADLVFDFQRGGKLLLGSEGVYLETTFEFLDDQTILVGNAGEDPIRMTWEVAGDSLTLTSGDEVQVLQREVK